MSDHGCVLPPHGERGIGAAMGVARVVAAVAVVAVAGTGCSSGAMSSDEFRAEARDSIERMVAAVGTAGFAARLARDDRAFGSYVAVLTDDAQQDGESAQESGASLQPPPDLGSVDGELDRLLGEAVDALHAANDTAQGPGPAALAAQAARLDDVNGRLAELKGRLA
jgi:hypothetical protein